MKIIGLDLSLTSTGIATSIAEPYRVKTKAKDDLAVRIHQIAEQVVSEITPDSLLLIEEVPTHGAFNIAKLAKIHGAILDRLVENDEIVCPYIYVSPPVLKKYATGKGNANKDAVLAEAIRRFDFQGSSNDEADAWILMHMGLDLAGERRIQVPAIHRDVLDKLVISEEVEKWFVRQKILRVEE